MRLVWRTIILLGVVSFLTDVSSEMVHPVLPLFLVTVLSASPAVLGLIEGAAESLSSILKVVSGYASDRLGRRKPFIVGGYSASSVSRAFLFLSNAWTHVFGLRLLDRSGKGLRTAPRDAVIAASAEEGTRGKAFGVHRALDTAGAIVGPIILLALLPLYSYREMFLIAAVPAFAAVALLFFLREPAAKKEPLPKVSISFRRIPGDLRWFIVIATVFALGNFSYAFFVLRVATVSGDPILAVYLYLLLNVVYAALCIPMGVVSDKIGRRPIIILGYAMFALTCIGFAISTSLVQFVLLFMLYGLFFAAADATQRAYVSDLSPEELRGTGLGTYHTAIGLAALPSSLAAGLIWSGMGPEAMFVYGVILSVAAIVMFGIRGGPKTNGKKEAPCSSP